MSLIVENDLLPTGGFPRVSGDEPALSARLRQRIEFSPRERG